MKLSKATLLLSSLLVFSWPYIAVADDCATHQGCETGKSCACKIPAEWTSDRYFYFDLQPFNKGHLYQCKLTSFPSNFLLMTSESVFPQGSKISCDGDNCPHFPLTLTIDTTNMIEEEDSARVKYLVPASDMPDDVSVNCVVADS
jgi:hypothetical protein